MGWYSYDVNMTAEPQHRAKKNNCIVGYNTSEGMVVPYSFEASSQAAINVFQSVVIILVHTSSSSMSTPVATVLNFADRMTGG